eukprot:COSAG01_NODE_2324_length_7907_cov_69.755763_12_plen_65_part_00
MKQINTQKMTQKEREDAVNEVGAASRPTCAPPVFGGAPDTTHPPTAAPDTYPGVDREPVYHQVQ